MTASYSVRERAGDVQSTQRDRLSHEAVMIQHRFIFQPVSDAFSKAKLFPLPSFLPSLSRCGRDAPSVRPPPSHVKVGCLATFSEFCSLSWLFSRSLNAKTEREADRPTDCCKQTLRGKMCTTTELTQNASNSRSKFAVRNSPILPDPTHFELLFPFGK